MVFTKLITAPTFLNNCGSVVASHFTIWSSTLPPPVAKARAISAAICAASSRTLNTFLKSIVRNFLMPAIIDLYSFCIPANKPSTALAIKFSAAVTPFLSKFAAAFTALTALSTALSISPHIFLAMPGNLANTAFTRPLSIVPRPFIALTISFLPASISPSAACFAFSNIVFTAWRSLSNTKLTAFLTASTAFSTLSLAQSQAFWNMFLCSFSPSFFFSSASFLAVLHSLFASVSACARVPFTSASFSSLIFPTSFFFFSASAPASLSYSAVAEFTSVLH
ncbi:hypothetical protein CLHUN_23470 [Ruminiclostridium hungatei]|uniref:Uncharacterized protein n=1 Tax=Ruminiclostridium hungatei TaxID=48256 RepID=A0A1V4SK90_RUMHU|nr:hypothetical protein CLHUN_23470 [Ruminiclostridium hungatei]